MKVRDERNPEQKKTHNFLIIGTDRVLSGWGRAEGGASYAAWACKPEHRDAVLRWVENRSDMTRVRETIDPRFDGTRYRPKGPGDCHIYVVDDNHPSLR